MALPAATGLSVILLMLLVISSEICVVKGLGVNWGTQAFNPLSPADVVKLMQLNGIKKVKIFDADYDVIRSMAGSGIEVMIAAPNDLLAKLAADSNAAAAWVKQNVTQFLFKGGVDIKWVAVGNEPFLTAYNNSFLNTTYPALLNMQTALEKAGHSEIRTIIPFNADVLTDGGTPSQTRFKPEYLDQIAPMLTIFNRTGAPFSVNLYPYISLYQNPNYPIDYAFFSGTTSPLVDGNIVYQNALDASLDGLISALTAAGYPSQARDARRDRLAHRRRPFRHPRPRRPLQPRHDHSLTKQHRHPSPPQHDPRVLPLRSPRRELEERPPGPLRAFLGRLLLRRHPQVPSQPQQRHPLSRSHHIKSLGLSALHESSVLRAERRRGGHDEFDANSAVGVRESRLHTLERGILMFESDDGECECELCV